MDRLLKLNLGCGKNMLPGYLNVDKFGTPDLLYDLEKFPWPWYTDSTDEIVMNHVLEHLGETSECFLGIIKELYRICVDGAILHIAVPHPRHDDFLNDPTHVRAVTPESLELFSRSKNLEWIQGGFSNSPLGVYLGVDFALQGTDFNLDEPWATEFNSRKLTQAEVLQAARRYNNVVKEIRMVLKVIKPGA